MLVAGKRHAVAHVVSGVMRSTHGCETDGEENDHTENKCRKTLREH